MSWLASSSVSLALRFIVTLSLPLPSASEQPAPQGPRSLGEPTRDHHPPRAVAPLAIALVAGWPQLHQTTLTCRLVLVLFCRLLLLLLFGFVWVDLRLRCLGRRRGSFAGGGIIARRKRARAIRLGWLSQTLGLYRLRWVRVGGLLLGLRWRCWWFRSIPSFGGLVVLFGCLPFSSHWCLTINARTIIRLRILAKVFLLVRFPG